VLLLESRQKCPVDPLARTSIVVERREEMQRLYSYIKDPSQVMRAVQLKLNIVKKPKFLLSTAFLPNRANAASSRECCRTKVGALTQGPAFVSMSLAMVPNSDQII